MYSQNDEEFHILKHLEHLSTGRFLDIGANDGRHISNTLALIERGWSGILVEANPLTFAKLAENHLDNERLILVNAAIGLQYRLTPFWTATLDDARPAPQPDPYAGLSTTEQKHRDTRLGGFRKPFYVPMVPLELLLHEFPEPIDFLSIDTEGTSTELFFHFPLRRIRPHVVCVEHDGFIEPCRSHAAHFYYREVAANAENLIFVADEATR